MNNGPVLVKSSRNFYRHDLVAGKEEIASSRIFKNFLSELNLSKKKNMMRKGLNVPVCDETRTRVSKSCII
jgi:hypothetical protein